MRRWLHYLDTLIDWERCLSEVVLWAFKFDELCTVDSWPDTWDECVVECVLIGSSLTFLGGGDGDCFLAKLDTGIGVEVDVEGSPAFDVDGWL